MTSPVDAVARQHLQAHLDWLRVLFNVHMRRMQRDGRGRAAVQSAGGALSDPLERDPTLDSLETQVLADATKARDAVLSELAKTGERAAADVLSDRLGLDADDRFILWCILAPEIDPAFRHIYETLDSRGHGRPTLAMLMESVVEPARWLVFRSRVDPGAPLVNFALVESHDDPSDTPSALTPLQPTAWMLHAATGKPELDLETRVYAELRQPVGLDKTRLTEAQRGSFDRVVRAVGLSDSSLMVLRGTDGAGRAHWLTEMAGLLGHATLIVDVHAATLDVAGHGETATSALPAVLRFATREARVRDAYLGLRGWENVVERRAQGEDEAALAPQSSRVPPLRLTQALEGHPLPVALLVPPDFDEIPDVGRAQIVADVEMPSQTLAVEHWEAALSDPRFGSLVTAAELASTFRVTPGEIEAVAANALREMAVSGADALDMPTAQALIKAIRRHRLRDIATLVQREYRQEDLIVPETVTVQLGELVSRYRLRGKVMDEWGLGRRFGEAQAISALFEGPPGTGKTMAANVVARELGLDLFQVDLSKVMSKYIGETEKHLARLFDEADRAQALILFDEADSLFSKRTEVKNAHDRSANLKINYLLQRIEQFSGIAVLTTNLADGMDEALGRRLTMRVHFPKPDKGMRRQLWNAMLQGVPTQLDEWDLDELSERFELTGGLIRNSVLRAAFMAASRDIHLDLQVLEIAARTEQKHQGMLVRGDPIKDLVGLGGNTNA